MRWIAAILLVCALTGPLTAEEESSDASLPAEKGNFVDALMHRDMFYGADDYFGGDRDISYIDNARPSAEEPSVSVQTSVTSSRRTESDSDSSSDSDSPDGGGGSGGDDPGGDDTGDEEDEPDEPDDPDDSGGDG